MLTACIEARIAHAPQRALPGQVRASADMATENGKNSRERRLTAWKEIAAFVGRDERTVRRWEESRGLPVRRFPGAGHASVFAYTHEIEAWMRGSATADTAAAQSVTAEPNAPSRRVRPRLARWAAPVAVLALFGIAIAVMVTSYRGARTALLPSRLT